MTKFNVGDKVIFNKENAHVAKQFDYKINKPYEVQEVFPFHRTVQIINEKGSSHSFDEERFELVETKPTKNQRITALENEVAELRPLKQEVAELKLIVHELSDGRKTMRDVMNEVLSEPSTTNAVEDKSLTPNQQRAAIIEKAKKFVDDLKDKEGKYSKPATFGDRKLRFEFVVNPEKRTVVALGRLFYYPSIRTIYAKGIAKCNPSDVFNEHIGKAIALGRALGLDVSEFEQAVQPTVAIGQLLARIYNKHDQTRWKVDDLNDTGKNLTIIKNEFESLNGETADGGYLPNETWYKIINDTDAIYEVIK